MIEQTKIVPTRRFKEFTNTGTWEQRKLIDVAEMFDNLRIPVTASDRVEGNTAYYGANGIQDYVDGFTHDGEFVLIAEDGANDLINYPVNYVKGKIWVNNHAHVVSGKKSELDNLFLTARIKSMNISHWLVGGGRAKLNGDVLKKIPLTLPIYEEQKKIGAFFKQLDDAITLHQRKLEKSKALKSAYLSEMFPAEGELVPKRRFSGFTQNWEEKKMSEITDIYDGTHQTPQYTKSGIKFVSVENISTLESTKYISQTAYDKEYSNKQTEKGDVLMTRIGSIGTTKVIETNEPLAYYVTLALLKPKQIDSYFLACLISSPAVQKNIWKLTLHIAFPKKINLSEINQINLLIPKIEEQIKIGNFFKQLDDIITLHQRKLDKLQNLKKAYLHEMFV